MTTPVSQRVNKSARAIIFTRGACTIMGIVVGIILGIGLMHMRFEIEISNFDKAATYAYACNYSLRALGLLKEDQ